MIDVSFVRIICKIPPPGGGVGRWFGVVPFLSACITTRVVLGWEVGFLRGGGVFTIIKCGAAGIIVVVCI
jgi:hypothetical protein